MDKIIRNRVAKAQRRVKRIKKNIKRNRIKSLHNKKNSMVEVSQVSAPGAGNSTLAGGLPTFNSHAWNKRDNITLKQEQDAVLDMYNGFDIKAWK